MRLLKGFAMLVLSRHRDESIIIGEDIEITVVEIRGDKVRLGVKAPREVPVHRREVYEAINREGRRRPSQSANSQPAQPTGSDLQKVIEEATNGQSCQPDEG